MNFKVKVFANATLTALIGAVPLILVFLFVTLPMFRQRTYEYKKEATQIAVESVFQILNHYHDLEKQGKLTQEVAQAEAKLMISKLRYKGDEYFWIHDIQYKMIMHPMKPELDGQDVSNMADPNGVKLFQEMVKVVQKESKAEGFVEYFWPKPGEKEPVPKVSFVKLFNDWGWIVGNGVYIDELIASAEEVKNHNLKYFTLAILFLIGASIWTAYRQLKTWILPVQSVISELSDESSSLASSSSQLKQSSNQMKDAGNEQERAVGQIASAVTQMSESMKSSVETAKKSTELAKTTSELSHQSEVAVLGVEKALSEMVKTNQSTVDAFSGLSEQVKSVNLAMEEISSKTKVINDIVFQTKLLSFNASVEAARAGEHGKGFSVVAEEIGNLAKISGDSAIEISKILEKSKKLVDHLVNESQQKVNQIHVQTQSSVEQGVQSVQTCQKTLRLVADKANESNTMSQALLHAYEEQTQASSEIAHGIERIDQKTQNSLEEVAETQNLADVVSKNAGSLNHIVNRLQKVIKAG